MPRHSKGSFVNRRLQQQSMVLGNIAENIKKKQKSKTQKIAAIN